jgi:hypothetical protein
MPLKGASKGQEQPTNGVASCDADARRDFLWRVARGQAKQGLCLPADSGSSEVA